jgi:hypothetical protein
MITPRFSDPVLLLCVLSVAFEGHRATPLKGPTRPPPPVVLDPESLAAQAACTEALLPGTRGAGARGRPAPASCPPGGASPSQSRAFCLCWVCQCVLSVSSYYDQEFCTCDLCTVWNSAR